MPCLVVACTCCYTGSEGEEVERGGKKKKKKKSSKKKKEKQDAKPWSEGTAVTQKEAGASPWKVCSISRRTSLGYHSFTCTHAASSRVPAFPRVPHHTILCEFADVSITFADDVHVWSLSQNYCKGNFGCGKWKM